MAVGVQLELFDIHALVAVMLFVFERELSTFEIAHTFDRLLSRGVNAHDTDETSIAWNVPKVIDISGDDVDSHDLSCFPLIWRLLDAAAAESFLATFGRIQFVDWLELHVRVW